MRNMAWPATSTTTPGVRKTPEDFFKKRVEETTPKPIAIKALVMGHTETGKTYFAETFPEPIYYIDTELGATKIADRHFKGKDIRIYEALALDPLTDKPDPIGSLDKVEEALLTIGQVTTPNGTIVIDTITDVWLWEQAWLDKIADSRNKSTGDPAQYEWAKAQQRYRNMVMRLIAKPQHLVLVAQLQSKYDAHGKETAETVPHAYKQTPHWIDFMIRIAKIYNALNKQWEYTSTLEKCRFQRALNAEIKDITFVKLADYLETNLKLVVRRT